MNRNFKFIVFIVIIFFNMFKYTNAFTEETSLKSNCALSLRQLLELNDDQNSDPIISLFSGEATREEEIANLLKLQINIVDNKKKYAGRSEYIHFFEADLSRVYWNKKLEVSDEIGKSKNILMLNPWVGMGDAFLTDLESDIVSKYADKLYLKLNRRKSNLKKLSGRTSNPLLNRNRHSRTEQFFKNQIYQRLDTLINIFNIAKSYQKDDGQILIITELLNTIVYGNKNEIAPSLFHSTIYATHVKKMLKELYPTIKIKKSDTVKELLWPEDTTLDFPWGREFTTGWRIKF